MCLYYARLDARPGVIGRLDRALTFLDLATGVSTELEPAMLRGLTVETPVPPSLQPALRAQMRGQHAHLEVCLGS